MYNIAETNLQHGLAAEDTPPADPINGHWGKLKSLGLTPPISVQKVLSIRERQEKKISSTVFGAFRQLRTDLNDGERLNKRDFAKDLSDRLQPHLQRAHLAAAKDLAEQYGGVAEASVSEKWARTRSRELAQQLAGTTKEQLQADSELGDVLSKNRADIIAATEVTRAISGGQLAIVSDVLPLLGVNLAAEWKTEDDADVCDECDSLDGTDDWADEYPEGPPAHVNCRCMLVFDYDESAYDPVNKHWKGTLNSLRKNCGIGSGGFEPGNTCAKESGGGSGGGENASDGKGVGGGSKETATKVESLSHKDNPKIHDKGEAPTSNEPEDSDVGVYGGNKGYNSQYIYMHEDPKLKEILDKLPADNILKRGYDEPNRLAAPTQTEDGWQINPVTAALVKARNVDEISERMRSVPIDKVKGFVEEAMLEPLDKSIANDKHKQAATILQDLWASTSGDHNKWAQAVQQVADEHFGLQAALNPIAARSAEHGEDEGDVQKVKPLADGQRELRDRSRALAEQHKDVIKGFLQATYENTQARLKALGVENVTLFRGMAADKMPIAGEPRDKNGQAVVNKDKVQLQPLSSFSTESDDASAFAESNSVAHKLVMAIKVPREKIFSTALSGPGCANEHEMIVLGGYVEAKSVITSTGIQDEKAFWDAKPSPGQIGYAKATGKPIPKSYLVGVGIYDGLFTGGSIPKSLGYRPGLIAFATSLQKGYDPNEARGESGKWTGDGGSSGASSEPSGGKTDCPTNP